MYKVIVFAGTTEGYEISRFLSENQLPVLACVATEYGSKSLQENSCLHVQAGRLDEQQMRGSFFQRKAGAGSGCDPSVCGGGDTEYQESL